mmetsp:Transcript_4598/g.16173  ORF Transcript_4598/g.16173 Transcript_4598/m.16173 type:complete len:255 (+) Transcript_4598:1346-2110(+)
MAPPAPPCRSSTAPRRRRGRGSTCRGGRWLRTCDCGSPASCRTSRGRAGTARRCSTFSCTGAARRSALPCTSCRRGSPANIAPTASPCRTCSPSRRAHGREGIRPCGSGQGRCACRKRAPCHRCHRSWGGSRCSGAQQKALYRSDRSGGRHGGKGGRGRSDRRRHSCGDHKRGECRKLCHSDRYRRSRAAVKKWCHTDSSAHSFRRRVGTRPRDRERNNSEQRSGGVCHTSHRMTSVTVNTSSLAHCLRMGICP